MENVITRQSWIIKPEQSGKTFHMIKLMLDSLIKGSPFHLILCDNSLLLNNQTCERVLSKYSYHSNHVILNLSSSDKADIHSANDLYANVMDNKRTSPVGGVTMCSNSFRWADMLNIITRLNDEIILKRLNFTSIKVWVDEADKYKNVINMIGDLQKQIPILEAYFITATPISNPVNDNFEMNIIPLNRTVSDGYRGWNPSDLELEIFDSTLDTISFVEMILQNNRDQICPGSKWFIPAERTIKSHHAMRDLLCNYGFATIIINGDGVALYLSSNPKIGKYIKQDRKSPDTFLGIIKKAFIENNLDNVPLAITGYNCVSRGITLSDPLFQFDCSILSYILNAQEASQLAGRLKKDSTGWKEIKIPKVYTTKEFNKVATEMEIISRSLATIAYEKNERESSTIVRYNDMESVLPYMLKLNTNEKREGKTNKVIKQNKNTNSYDGCNKPLYVFDEFGDTIEKTSKKSMLKMLIDKYNLPKEYSDFKPRRWIVEKESFYKKWRIDKLLSASKSEYNSILARDGGIREDTVIVYVVKWNNINKIIVHPWEGSKCVTIS